MKPWLEKLWAGNNSMVMSGRYLREPAWTPSETFKKYRLDQKHRVDTDPVNLGSVIAFNESFMDVVDWAYQIVGPYEVIWTFIALGLLAFVGAFDYSAFASPPPPDQLLAEWALDSLVTVGFLSFALWFSRILFNTYTGCTHYPVRLDRKNQMVHVFRHNGEGGVSSYRWRDITFGFGGGALQRGLSRSLIHGYVQREDGSYDYFRLGVMNTSIEVAIRQWEYYRRYMEEGPDAVPAPELLLPIDGKRESFRVGAQHCWFVFGPYFLPAILFAILNVPGSLLRWFIMHVTRRLPRWPQHILDLCPVAPNDSYAFKPLKPVNVSLTLAFVVTVSVLALDSVLLYHFIHWLRQPGFH